MSKFFRTFITIFMIIIISFSFYTVKATDDDVENTAYYEEETTTGNVIKENASDSSLQTLTPSSVTSVSNKNNYTNANLALNNILCIILISIGVLLILFAIAILIRLKN